MGWLLILAVPLSCGMAAMLADRLLTDQGHEGGGVEAAAAAGCGLGIAAAWFLAYGAPSWPAESWVELLPWCAVLGAVLGLFDVALRATETRVAVRTLPPLLAFWLLPGELVAPLDPTAGQLTQWTAALGVGGFVTWRLFDGLCNWMLPAMWTALLTLWAAGVAGLLALVAGGPPALVAGGALLAAAGLAVSTWNLRFENPTVDAAGLPIVFILIATLIGAQAYESLDPWAVLIVLLIPALLFASVTLQAWADLPDAQHRVTQSLIVLVLMTLACILAAGTESELVRL